MAETINRIAATLVLAALASGCAVAGAQPAQRFDDVPPQRADFEAVEWAAEAGITLGYGDGTFRPDEPMSRSHALAFVGRLFDDVLGAESSEHFTRGDMMTVLHAVAAAEPSAGAAAPADAAS